LGGGRGRFARAYSLGNQSLALLERICSSESFFRRVVAESAGSAAPLWAYRGESLAKRQLWTEAAADCGTAVRLRPEDLDYRQHQILALLAAGDHAVLRRTRTDMLDRFRTTTDPMIANSVAWSSVTAASEEPNLSETRREALLPIESSAVVELIRSAAMAVRDGPFAGMESIDAKSLFLEKVGTTGHR